MNQKIDPKNAPAGVTAGLQPPVAALLARHGLARAAIEPLQSDASARRYFRLPNDNLLLMDDRTDPESFRSYIAIARHLRALGLSAPHVVGIDAATCIALIEDFGTQTYSNLLARGYDESALYRLATDALIHLHRHPDATGITLPEYSVDVLLDELEIFVDWFASGMMNEDTLKTFRQTFRRLWNVALQPIVDAPRTLVLRDFHVDNLMLINGRDGITACGILDFQDAVIGAGEYDLVSLLQDARRDVPEETETAMLARYIDLVPDGFGTPDDIRRRYYLLGAQRHARIIGVFIRLFVRDGKPGYLRFMPRVLRQLDKALADAGLSDIAACLHDYLPDWQLRGAARSAELLKTSGAAA